MQLKNTTLYHNLGIILDKNVTSVILRLLPFLADRSFSEFFQQDILPQLVQIVENCENNTSTKASFYVHGLSEAECTMDSMSQAKVKDLKSHSVSGKKHFSGFFFSGNNTGH